VMSVEDRTNFPFMQTCCAEVARADTHGVYCTRTTLMLIAPKLK
jgi:hypothetical protein